VESWLSAPAYESRTGPNARIPRRSNPSTTSQVIFLLATQTTASAPESRYAAYASRRTSGLPRSSVFQMFAEVLAGRERADVDVASRFVGRPQPRLT